ncbi:hypothetical protein CDCA_CDCA08G2350 [Cyanidium caldarium]|uniref:Uncharacterized protein n=1 Tax=Cyanidium caldarium TaxID=2771 RepID=A0AAV9IW51_CYACA|nr:hypothetical protein CDCA_CDCA08G2350 [Cyanidium caldarium]
MERRKAGLDEALFDSAQRSVSADVYVRLFARQLHGALRPVPQESSKDGNRTMTWRRDCALWLVPLTWVCEVRRVREQRPGQTFKRPRRRVLWQRRIDKVELCGVVRELQTKWNFREWMIDDGTGVACAQEWWRGPAATGVNSSASAELEASRTESPGAAHSLAEVGSLVVCRGRLEWYRGRFLCQVDSIQTRDGAAWAGYEWRWWCETVAEQRRRIRLARRPSGRVPAASAAPPPAEPPSIALRRRLQRELLRQARLQRQFSLAENVPGAWRTACRQLVAAGYLEAVRPDICLRYVPDERVDEAVLQYLQKPPLSIPSPGTADTATPCLSLQDIYSGLRRRYAPIRVREAVARLCLAHQIERSPSGRARYGLAADAPPDPPSPPHK